MVGLFAASHGFCQFPAGRRENVYERVREYCAGNVRAPFSQFYMLNGHGGNINKLQIIVERLRATHHLRLNVISVTYWHLFMEELRSIRESPMGGIAHSGELETCLMLMAHPELVRRNRIEADGLPMKPESEGCDMFAPGSDTTARAFKERSRKGGATQ